MGVYDIRGARGTLWGSLLSGNPTLWGVHVRGPLFFVNPQIAASE